jgi:hypothetical protein
VQPKARDFWDLSQSTVEFLVGRVLQAFSKTGQDVRLIAGEFYLSRPTVHWI